MAKEKILIVDDKADILELVGYNFIQDAYQVKVVLTGEQAVKEAADNPTDLILLDLKLPGLEGLRVCRELKSNSKTRHIPIIMLSAKGEDADIVSGLELGADDYILKPFSPRVLLARVRVVLRKNRLQEDFEDALVDVHGLTIDPVRHKVLLNGTPLALTAIEFRILYLMVQKPGWVFSRSQIIRSVKGQDCSVTERSVDVQIVALRKKLGNAGKLIETIRGVGYRFKE